MKWYLAVAMILLGCGGTTETGDSPSGLSKGDVASASGKGDSADLDQMCEDLGREPGCDPCSIEQWYGDGNCDDFCPVRDSDCGIDSFSINVDVDPGMSAQIEVVYQATKDSFGCTDLVFDGVTPKRVPEQNSETLEGSCVSADESSVCTFEFPNDQGDDCLSVMRHIYLYPRNAEATIDPVAALEFSLQEDLASDFTEEVGCLEILYGPNSDTPAMQCGNDLLHYTASGTANVQLNLLE